MFTSHRRKMMLAGASATFVAALAFAPSASAHECFKKSWTDAAYARALESDHYMSLAVLADQFIVASVAPDCVGVLDYESLWASWMEENGISHVPLVWSKENPEQAFKAWENEKGNSGPGLLGSGNDTAALGYLGNHIPTLESTIGAGLEAAVVAGLCEFPGV